MTSLDKRHENDLIKRICIKADGIGDTLASYISENFDSLEEFLNGKEEDFVQIVDRKNMPKLKALQISKILESKKNIPKKLSVRETAFFVLTQEFLNSNIKNLQELQLEKMDINPFLAKALAMKTAEEIISFNVYQAVTRSIVTSWGMMVENFLVYAGSEKNKNKFTDKEGANPDIKKEVANRIEYLQIKSGPNTMNVSMVNSLNDVIEDMKRKNLKCYLGMTYGKRERISPQIKGYLKNFDDSTLIGKELWDYISEEKNCHERIIKAMTEATGGMLTKSFIDMIDDKIGDMHSQWKTKFGSKTLEESFETYL